MARKKSIKTDAYNDAFPSRLREIMRLQKKNQQDIADLLGQSRQSVSYYCDGTAVPNWKTIVQLAQYFGVSSDWLLGLSDVKATDIELKAICEYTGLTEESIEKLQQYKDSEVIELFNNFICTSKDALDYLSYVLKICTELYCNKPEQTNNSDNQFIIENGRLSVPLSTSATYMEVIALRAISTATESALFATIDNLADKYRKKNKETEE